MLPAVPGSTPAATRRRVLFATGAGARMYRAEVRTLLRRLGRAAGLPDELAGSLSPHSMRHAFATLNLDAGASLRDLQDAMGHASPRTTRRYDRSRGNLDRSPATCSPGTSAAPAELHVVPLLIGPAHLDVISFRCISDHVWLGTQRSLCP